MYLPIILSLLSLMKASLANPIAIDRDRASDLNLRYSPTTNLTGPRPPPAFTIKTHLRNVPIDEDAFYAVAINTLVIWALEDYSGDIVGSETHYAPSVSYRDYQRIRLEVNANRSMGGHLPRKFAIWGLSEITKYLAARRNFRAGYYELFWEGVRQGSIVISLPPHGGGAVFALNNTIDSVSSSKLKDDEDPVIETKLWNQPIEKHAALLALVSALTSASQYSPHAITHGLSTRVAPWPAYFRLSDFGWEGQKQPRTEPPYLTWKMVVEAARYAFEEYQVQEMPEHSYLDMGIVLKMGEMDLARGGVDHFPTPESQWLGQE